MDPLADLDRAARAFGNNDHEVRILGQTRLPDAVNDVTVKIKRLFRHQNRRCTGGKPDIKCQMARVAAHDLNDGAPLIDCIVSRRRSMASTAVLAAVS